MIGKKLLYDDVKSYIESFEYKLLSTEYKNASTKLKLQCPEGHIYEVTYGNFYTNHRCPECSGLKRKTLGEVKSYIESFNYKILSTKYINSQTKLKLQCPEGHIFEMRYTCFKRGQRCSICDISKKLTLEDVKSYIESFEYKLLSTEYKNSKSYLKLQCPEGHIYNTIYNIFQQNHRCPECASVKGWSKPEKEIAEYVRTIYSGNIIENDRTQIKNFWSGYNLELDIWLPEMKKAIEFNGEYWHKDDKSRWYDEIKKKQCVQKNINLLVVNEHDWYNNKENNLKLIQKFLRKVK